MRAFVYAVAPWAFIAAILVAMVLAAVLMVRDLQEARRRAKRDAQAEPARDSQAATGSSRWLLRELDRNDLTLAERRDLNGELFELERDRRRRTRRSA
jgi:hypothetical protein